MGIAMKDCAPALRRLGLLSLDSTPILMRWIRSAASRRANGTRWRVSFDANAPPPSVTRGIYYAIVACSD